MEKEPWEIEFDEKYQRLRQVIIAANPEIVEWKNGCRYIDKKGLGHVLSIPNIGLEGLVYYNTERELVRQEDVKEIAGRPIRLADVLLALQANNVEVDLASFIHKVSELENIHMEKDVLRIRRGTVVSWNLRHDDLDWHYRNKPETVQFLIDLLVK